MRKIKIIRFQLTETHYVDFEDGYPPSVGDAVSLDGTACVVARVSWNVDDYHERGYARCILTAHLVPVPKLR
jgi:hypothetical protein